MRSSADMYGYGEGLCRLLATYHMDRRWCSRLSTETGEYEILVSDAGL
jgi:hypothetical protein